MNKDKEKLALVLEKMLERLDVIDAGQARVLGNTAAMRDSLHNINNELTTLKCNQALDSEEITKILKKLDVLAKGVTAVELKEYVKDAAG